MIIQTIKTNIGKKMPAMLFLPFFTNNSPKLLAVSIFFISFFAYFIYILLNRKLNNIHKIIFNKKNK